MHTLKFYSNADVMNISPMEAKFHLEPVAKSFILNYCLKSL